MHQRFARNQIFHQESLRKISIFSQIFFTLALMIQYISLSLHQFLNRQISLLSLKKMIKVDRQIACVWFRLTGTKTYSKLGIKQKGKNQNWRIVSVRKFYLEYLKDLFLANCYLIFFVWLVLYNERNWFC